ncbi:hypothetical protein ACNSOL_12105 (plasmid) [Aliarcobacter lanthieri]|uniref:hypothetical protein n=1 Tax=Aliarcobacter lanthieri TaxID=1355374 RepID=UPI003AAACF60
MNRKNNGTKIEDYKSHLYKENIDPIKILSNLDFCKITNTKSVGNYQFNGTHKHFTFREISNIHKLQKIDLLTFATKIDEVLKDLLKIKTIEFELKEQNYYLYFIKENQSERHYFSNIDKNLFRLLIKFYLFAKNESKKI